MLILPKVDRQADVRTDRRTYGQTDYRHYWISGEHGKGGQVKIVAPSCLFPMGAIQRERESGKK